MRASEYYNIYKCKSTGILDSIIWGEKHTHPPFCIQKMSTCSVFTAACHLTFSGETVGEGGVRGERQKMNDSRGSKRRNKIKPCGQKKEDFLRRDWAETIRTQWETAKSISTSKLCEDIYTMKVRPPVNRPTPLPPPDSLLWRMKAHMQTSPSPSSINQPRQNQCAVRLN